MTASPRPTPQGSSLRTMPPTQRRDKAPGGQHLRSGPRTPKRRRCNQPRSACVHYDSFSWETERFCDLCSPRLGEEGKAPFHKKQPV